MKNMSCPLCANPHYHDFCRDNRRQYLRCDQCLLVFVPEHDHLPCEAERAEYEKHENDPNDMGYRQFLSRVSEPMLANMRPASQGLDFGCGPGPTLSKMFEEQGHDVDLYDVYFSPDVRVFQKKYDFISATEVVEHLSRPGFELDRLWSMLKPGGVLGAMTKLVLNRDAFAQWHYKNDPTHICFFSIDTLNWLADKWRAELTMHAKDAFTFKKPEK